MLAEQEHYGDLRLRRYFIGEAPDEALTDHLEDCGLCRSRIEALVAEEGRFPEQVPFESFAEGVEDKLAARQTQSATRQWIAPLSAVAAAAAIILAVALPGPGENLGVGGLGHNTLKGTATVVDLYVGGVAGQRTAASREPLSLGERVRIAYRPGPWRYLAVISVDEEGAVSALYPEEGQSLPVDGEPRQTRMLPDSVAFSGAGLERIVVAFSDTPLALSELEAAAREAYAAAGGDLDRMGELELPGEQFHRVVIKP